MRITGSKVHRIWKCPASAVLPQHAMDIDRLEWEPMRTRGQGVHGFLEVVGKVGRGAALAAAPADVVPLLEALDLDNLPVGLATEVSFAWNWQTGAVRELGRNLPRRPDGGVDYDAVSFSALCSTCQRRLNDAAAEGKEGALVCDACLGGAPVDWSCEVPLTIDVMGVALKEIAYQLGDQAPRRGYVGDYKSGHTKYPAPDMFGQTLLAALCVARLYGCDDVVVELLHIHDNGGHHAVRRTVNEWDLLAFEAELQHATYGAIRQPEGIENDIHEGAWCDYCPAFRSCPAKLALVRAIPEQLVQLGIRQPRVNVSPCDAESGQPMVDESPALVLTPGALTIRNAGAAWEAIERIEDVLARAKEEICSIGAFEEIPLSDGRVIGRLRTERKGLNGKVAAELLRKRLGPAAAEYIEESVTLDALRKAVAKHRRPGEKIETKAGDGVYDKALQEVERRGGLELKVTDAVRPHVPKKRPG